MAVNAGQAGIQTRGLGIGEPRTLLLAWGKEGKERRKPVQEDTVSVRRTVVMAERLAPLHLQGWIYTVSA